MAKQSKAYAQLARSNTTSKYSDMFSPAKMAVTPVSEDPHSYVLNGLQNLSNTLAQNKSNQMMMVMYQQEQEAAKAAELAKIQSFKPYEGLTGMPASTLANTDASVLNTLLADGLKKSQAIQNAQSLQEQYGTHPVTMNDPGFLNLSNDGYNKSYEQAYYLANNPEASKAIGQGFGDVEAYKQKTEALNGLVPDRSTLNGQKAYLNGYQALFGAPAVTDVSLAQHQGNLQNTLLGNQQKAIQNQYLPASLSLGNVNAGLTAQKQTIDNTYAPFEKQANIGNTQANTGLTLSNTTGKDIGNEAEAIKLQQMTDVADIMSRPGIPVAQKVAAIATMGYDPQEVLTNLKALEAKGGIAGVKPDEMHQIQAQLVEASKPKRAIAPMAQPIAQRPATAGSALYPKPQGGKYYLGGQPTMGEAVGHFLGGLFTPDPNSGAAKLSQQLKQHQLPAAQKPTLPIPLSKQINNVNRAKKSAIGNMNAANANIQKGNALLADSQQAISSGQAMMQQLNEAEKQRAKQMRALGL